jgi:hypothetical protein
MSQYYRALVAPAGDLDHGSEYTSTRAGICTLHRTASVAGASLYIIGLPSYFSSPALVVELVDTLS